MIALIYPKLIKKKKNKKSNLKLNTLKNTMYVFNFLKKK